MNFSSYIKKDFILTGEKPSEKDKILYTIAGAVCKTLPLKGLEEKVYKALQEREFLGSTGFAKGVAIPHCKLKEVEDFYIGVITVPEGTDFDSLDGQKTKLIFFIIAPESKRNEHIHILSKISRHFNDLKRINQIVEMEDPEKLLSFIKEMDSADLKSKSLVEYCNIQIYVQDEEKFDEILEILSGVDDCSLSISEANNSGHYLNSLPLFASFWNEEQKQSQKIITAIIDKTFSNDIIRQIQDFTGDIHSKSGIMITLHDVIYKSGSLNL